jgi:hypothetical protein
LDTTLKLKWCDFAVTVLMKTNALALMGTASPDLGKQGFFAVVFVNREYSGQQEPAPNYL